MFFEAFHLLASLPGTPPPFRRHLREAMGLWARGYRQRHAWYPHLRKIAGLIEHEITLMPETGRRTVVVLGSGPLFDVPVESLARTFRHVVLVDQAHPAAARFRVRQLRNVHFHWHDLSVVDEPEPLAFLFELPELDWVISVNLVSQLAIGAPEGRERAVIDAHLNTLAELPCKVSLATDLDYELIDRDGKIVERFDLLHGHSMPPAERYWSWDVVPFGEEDRNTHRVHRCTFYPDWAAARRHQPVIKSP